MIDGVVLSVILLVFLIPAALISGVLIVIVLVLWFTAGHHVAYLVLTQRGRGQSPGKRVAGLRVVDRAGEPPGSAALVRRSLPLLLEYTLILAFLAMMSSPYRQRLGDRWARTYVIAA